MKVELIGFSQGVSFAKRDEMLNYLDFRTETGKAFRVPIPEESMQVLLKEVYDGAETKEASSEPEQESATPEGVPEFGGDFDETFDEGLEDDGQGPQSEDEVPPL